MRPKLPLILAALILSSAGAYVVSEYPVFPVSPAVPVVVAETSSERARALVAAARAQIGVVTQYSTAYYSRESIPPQAGACADVVWRAMAEIGYDLPSVIERDLHAHPERYPASPAPDPNVNFRRVKIIRAFLETAAQKLPTRIMPGVPGNLAAWQAGDIVTFAASPATGGLEHIAIVSDRRDADGVPMIIHNYGEGTKEGAHLLAWPTPITGHYRFFSLPSRSAFGLPEDTKSVQ